MNILIITFVIFSIVLLIVKLMINIYKNINIKLETVYIVQDNLVYTIINVIYMLIIGIFLLGLSNINLTIAWMFNVLVIFAMLLSFFS